MKSETEENVIETKTYIAYTKALNIVNSVMASFLISNCNFLKYDFYKLKKYFGHFCPAVTSAPRDYNMMRTFS